MDVVIPNLGDIDEVEVIELCVTVGDAVDVDDALIVIESDKASMEVPSPIAGTVDSLQVVVGDLVAEGHLIGSVQGQMTQSTADVATPQTESIQTPQPTVQVTPTPLSAELSEIEVLVPDIGEATGVVVIEVAVKTDDEIAVDDLLVVLESDKASMEITAEYAGTVLAVAVVEGQEVVEGTLIAMLNVQPAVASELTVEPQLAVAPEIVKQSPAPDDELSVASSASVYAGPAVRRLARELGVELVGIKGSGNRNRITKDDVKGFVKARMQSPQAPGLVEGSTGTGIPLVAVIDYAKFGPIETVDLTRIQQRGADNLYRSWINLPHVTQHDEADISDLEAFRQSLKSEAERKGVKVTPLAFLAKACCHALAEYPYLNASLHEDRQHLVVKQYINIGIAVDTPQGLVVPVVREADKKNIWQLSAEIAELSEKARLRKLTMDDLQGGTFTLSSLGALGGTGFTPIVNAPEVAILGVAKLQTKPVWDGTTFQPRKILPLSLSYDHRVINGADGGRFMLLLTSVLSDIRRLAL